MGTGFLAVGAGVCPPRSSTRDQSVLPGSTPGVGVMAEAANSEPPRAVCPSASGDHGDAWMLKLQVARRMDHTPRELHKRAEEIFGEDLPCMPGCPYVRRWNQILEENPDLAIGDAEANTPEEVREWYEEGKLIAAEQ